MATPPNSSFNPSAQVFTASSPDQALQTWIAATGANNRGMTLVTAGQAGAGKSTLVKNMLRLKEEDSIPVGKHFPSPVTDEVKVYEHNVDGVQVKIVDMPGLAAPDQNEKELIAQLQKKTKGEADMLLYCVSMAPCSKLGYIDIGIVRLLTATFKKEIWERTILVLTFGDLAKAEVKFTKDKAAAKEKGPENRLTEGDIQEGMEEIVNNYTRRFEKILGDIVKPKKSQQLRVCPLDPNDIRNPRDRFQIAAIPTSKDREEKILYEHSWDNYVYLEVLRKCNRDAIPAFLKISRHNLVAEGVGAGAVGLGVGVSIGAAVGASLGLGVGTIPGAAIGGALGLAAGAAGAIIARRFSE